MEKLMKPGAELIDDRPAMALSLVASCACLFMFILERLCRFFGRDSCGRARGLGSIGRIRIIAELARKPNDSFSKHSLEAATGIKRKDIKSSVKRLIAIGWMLEDRTFKVASLVQGLPSVGAELRFQVQVGLCP